MVNVKLLLMFKDGRSLDCKSYFYTVSECTDETSSDVSYRSLAEQWKCTEVLPVDVLTTAIGVLKLSSCQHDRKIVLSAVITYSMENETSRRIRQLPVPDIEIDVEDIVRSSLALFQNIPTVSEEDLLSVLVSSHCFQLLTSEPVTEILKEKFEFSSLLDYGRYYNSGNGLKYFSGVFLESWHDTGPKFHLNLYTKDSSQALSVVHCLYSVLPHGAYIIPFVKERSPDLQKMYGALEEEINFTVEQLSNWEEKYDVVDGHIHIPRKEYFQYKSSAFKLEMKTDELHVKSRHHGVFNFSNE
ncbi:hypothetical protein R5R35_006013 [Gryllus longicercus]|uniref:Uncharacterized protein n=1 Tax=Gryllus longicercus TaxID=2509291 RepID=A0AAN9Z700_9ORTH